MTAWRPRKWKKSKIRRSKEKKLEFQADNSRRFEKSSIQRMQMAGSLPADPGADWIKTKCPDKWGKGTKVCSNVNVFGAKVIEGASVAFGSITKLRGRLPQLRAPRAPLGMIIPAGAEARSYWRHRAKIRTHQRRNQRYFEETFLIPSLFKF